MLTLMPTFKSEADHPEMDPVVELATLFKQNDVQFSLLFTEQMPDLRRLLYQIGLESFPWTNVFDDIQHIRSKAGLPFSIQDVVLPADVTPYFIGNEVIYFRGSERVMQVHLHDDGFVYSVRQQLPDKKTLVEQYDDRGFVTTRTLTDANGSQKKDWLDDYGHVILTQTKQGVTVAANQKDRFAAAHYHSMQDIVYEFLMKRSMQIEQSLQVVTNLSTQTLELRSGQPLLKQMIFLVNQRLNVVPKEMMSVSDKDIFVFPTSADQELFVRAAAASDFHGHLPQIQKRVIPQYATDLKLGISNETALDLIYWRLGDIQENESRRLFLKLLDMLRHADDQTLVAEGTKDQVEMIQAQLAAYVMDRFEVDLESKDYQAVANFAADQRSDKPVAGMAARAKKVHALPDWQKLSAAEFIVSRVHVQESQHDSQEAMMHQARIYVDTATIPDLRLMISAISHGVPLLVRQANTLIRDHQNGIIIQDLAEIPEASRYFLKTLRHWNDALVVNAELIETFSANHLIEKWQEVMAVGKTSN
ncbi:MAG: accessory Sec system protein Asp1 [Lacticaseibacillus paracasei]|uniref:accessory Sec system protein Asp1 n=1 Tax=Lacticaseibacillus paracasei TaxID=1597 RepID=UPI00345DD394